MKFSLINNETGKIYTLSGVSKVTMSENRSYICVVFNKMFPKELINLAIRVQEEVRGECVDYYPSLNMYRIHNAKRSTYSFYKCQDE